MRTNHRKCSSTFPPHLFFVFWLNTAATNSERRGSRQTFIPTSSNHSVPADLTTFNSRPLSHPQISDGRARTTTTSIAPKSRTACRSTNLPQTLSPSTSVNRTGFRGRLRATRALSTDSVQGSSPGYDQLHYVHMANYTPSHHHPIRSPKE